MNVILFDDEWRSNLFPLASTRPIGAFRIGILTIAEKWEHLLQAKVSYKTAAYLQGRYPAVPDEENLFINGRYLPDHELKNAVSGLRTDEILIENDKVLACRLNKSDAEEFLKDNFSLADHKPLHLAHKPVHLSKCPDVFSYNEMALRFDFELLTKGRTSEPLHQSNQVIAPEQVFIEPGAVVSCSVINASSGPVYIGKDAEVMEGCLIRGPFALGTHSQLKMGAKIYGATTIGPHCKVGGEVNNSVLFGYSNKAHDGFLGNSVIGEWCNLGADSNTSNLKNNYAEVRLWNYPSEKYLKTGMQFCGTIMGDHSKCGINTMFNTGTVVGVSANVFGAGYPRNFIPDFSWGGAQGFETFSLVRSFEVAGVVMGRRGLQLSAADKDLLTYVFNETQKFRTWDSVTRLSPVV